MDEAAVESVRGAFNEQQDAVRVVSLLSPTCLVCQYGQGVVQGVFDVAPDAGLWGLIAWIPMMDVDSKEAGETEMRRFTDSRIRHVWDGRRTLGELFRHTLALEKTAWDVYLLYGRGIMWTDAIPPGPALWMHQLPTGARADPALLLHPGRFAQRVSELLGREPEDIPADTALYLHARGLSRVKAERPHPQPTLEEVVEASVAR